MELSPIECFLKAAYERGHCTNQYLASVKFKGRLEKERIIGTLSRLFDHFHFLRARTKNKKELAFDLLFSEVPIRFASSYDVASYENLLEQLLYLPPNTLAYWHALILEHASKSFEILFVFNHMIMDGTLFKMLLRNFLQSYEDPSSVLDSEEIGCRKRKKLKNAFIRFHDLRFLFRQRQLEYDPPRRVPLDQRRCQHYSVDLSSKALVLLKAKSKDEDVSLNALLTASLVKAFSEITLKKNLFLHTMIDLRKHFWVQEPARFQADCIRSDFSDLNRYSLLELARCYEKGFKEKLSRHKGFAQWIPSFLMVPFTEILKIKKDFFLGLGISNLMTFDPPPFMKSLHIEHCRIYLNRILGDYVFQLVLLTVEGKMNASFSYTSPLIERSLIEKVANRFIEILEAFAEAEQKVISLASLS